MVGDIGNRNNKTGNRTGRRAFLSTTAGAGLATFLTAEEAEPDDSDRRIILAKRDFSVGNNQLYSYYFRTKESLIPNSTYPIYSVNSMQGTIARKSKKSQAEKRYGTGDVAVFEKAIKSAANYSNEYLLESLKKVESEFDEIPPCGLTMVGLESILPKEVEINRELGKRKIKILRPDDFDFYKNSESVVYIFNKKEYSLVLGAKHNYSDPLDFFYNVDSNHTTLHKLLEIMFCGIGLYEGYTDGIEGISCRPVESSLSFFEDKKNLNLSIQATPEITFYWGYDEKGTGNKQDKGAIRRKVVLNK